MNNPLVVAIVNTLGAIGWIVGLASGWLTWKSYRDQKKLESSYHYILEKAEREWEGTYTKQQIKELKAQFQKLELQIRQEVPKEAKRVFLEEQRDALVSSMGESYQNYLAVSNELQNSSSGPLHPTLRSAIETRIMPAYVQRQRQQRTLYVLVLGIFLLNLFPFITEYLIRALFSLSIPVLNSFVPTSQLVAYLSGFVLTLFVALSYSDNRAAQLIRKSVFASRALAMILVLLWVVCVVFVVFDTRLFHGYANVGLEIIVSILSYFPLALGAYIVKQSWSR